MYVRCPPAVDTHRQISNPALSVQRQRIEIMLGRPCKRRATSPPKWVSDKSERATKNRRLGIKKQVTGRRRMRSLTVNLRTMTGKSREDANMLKRRRI